MVEAVMEGIAVTGLDGTVTEANEKAVQMFGCRSEDELLGKNALDLIAQRDCRRAAANVQEVRKQGVVRYIDCTLVKVDGSEYPGEIRASMKRDASGNPVGLIEIIRDTTERKQAVEGLKKHREHLEELVQERTAELTNANERLQREITERRHAEEALRRSEKQASAAIEAARALTFDYDIATGEINWGGAIEAITGYTPEEFAQVDIQGWAEMIHPDDRDEILAILQEAMGKDRATAEYRFKTKKGYVTLASISITQKQDGKPVRLVGILQDITERKLIQERLIASERLATLGQFSGSISHELRNSLATIDSSAYYLGTKLRDTDGKVQEHLKRIKSSVDNATTIIQSLLTLTRMREPKLARLDLRAITSEAVAAAKVPVAVGVIRDFPKQEVGVNADPEQLSMAFKNIVDNAGEAMGGRGTLTVTARTAAAGQAEVSFADTGPGIPPEDLDRVFEPLFSTKAKGIGFGLSIARMVIDRHGGTIEAGSEPAKGATITIRLPLNMGEGKEG